MSRKSNSRVNANIKGLKDQIDWISGKLEKAENSGFTDDGREDILKQSKSLLND